MKIGNEMDILISTYIVNMQNIIHQPVHKTDTIKVQYPINNIFFINSIDMRDMITLARRLIW